jgi:hypothetical protein
MASVSNAQRVTYEEWLQMPIVEDAIEEVVDGEIVEVLSTSNTPCEVARDGEFRRAALLIEGILKPTQFPHVQIDIAQIWLD